MLRLQDIMTAQVVTISPELTLRESMELLAKHHVSGAPVVASGKVLGVLSASDIIAFVSSMRGVPTEREDESEDPWEAAEEWVEGDDPPGSYFTSLWADAGADVSGRTSQPEGADGRFASHHYVFNGNRRGGRI